MSQHIGAKILNEAVSKYGTVIMYNGESLPLQFIWDMKIWRWKACVDRINGSKISIVPPNALFSSPFHGSEDSISLCDSFMDYAPESIMTKLSCLAVRIANTWRM